MEQTNTPIIEQLQQTLLSLDAELAHYAEQDERLAAHLIQMHNSALASTQNTLDRLLNEVFNKTQLLKSQREHARFRAEHERRMGIIQGVDVAGTSSTYVGGFEFLRRESEDATQWADVPLQTSLPVQQEMGNLTLSITGLQTSSDTLRILFRIDSSSIQEPLTEEDATRRLFPSFTGVVITDDLDTKYVIGQIESVRSTSRYDTATQRSEQTSESIMILAPTLPTNAQVFKITIQNVCFTPFGHSLFIKGTAKLIEGPWTFEFVIAK